MAAALYVPIEIIETILLKLPIKSLLRFKSVSKSWNSIISDPRFIQTHYQLSMAKSENSLFLKEEEEDGWFSIVRLEDQHLTYDGNSCSFLGWQYKTFLCIGDGLVLLGNEQSSYDDKTYLLWNPRTRQEIILPFPYYPSHLHTAMYGVCYDPINEDVKVVIASEDFYTVYSCKNRSWAEKKNFPYEIAPEGGLAVDGAIYWARYNWSSSMIILCFDSKDDSFKILLKPEDKKDDQWFKLNASNGRLYLCCNGEDGKMVEFWVKEKEGGGGGGGWSEKVLVNIDDLDNVSIHPTVVAPLTENEMNMWFGWAGYCVYNCCYDSYREIDVGTTLWQMFHPLLESMFPFYY